MGNQGYWIVTVSISPWRRARITVIEQGIDRERAAIAAIETITQLTKGQ